MSYSLIGREHPAAILRTEVGRVLDSHGGLVFVTGEAGIGKTTLLAEAAEDAARRGARVLSASCWEGDGAPGCWPWVQVVRDLARTATTREWALASATAGDRLPVLLGETVQPSAAARPAADNVSFRLYDAFTTLLVTAARSKPTVIVLDDLHWADPASLRLLDFLARHAWFEPLLVMGTYRDVEVEQPAHRARGLLLPLASRARTVRLSGLDVAQVGALIERTTGSAAGAGPVAEIHRRTGGNPFFVEQTAHLGAGGAGGAGGEPVGASVRDAVQQRLGLLPPAVVQMLVTAAVIGHEFTGGLLAATHAARLVRPGRPPRTEPPASAGPHPPADLPGEISALLEPALATRLVSRTGDRRYAFTHDLVRECLYTSLDAHQRRAGHLAVLRVLDGQPELSPAALAHHGRLAMPLLPGGEAAGYLLAAARHACSRLASEEAVGHYRAALEAAGHGPGRDRARIELELAAQLDRAGELTAARATFTSVLDTGRELADAGLVARAALGLHRLGNPSHQANDEIDLMDEARAGLEHRPIRGGHQERGDAALRARVLAAGSMARTHRAVEPHTARKLGHAAVTLAREQGDEETLGWCLLAHHDAIWGPGSEEERITILDELTAAARRAADRELESLASFLRTLALLEQGSPASHDELDTFTALTERTRLPRHRFLAISRRGTLAALRGRFDEARRHTDAARVLGERVGEVDSHRVWRDQVWALELLRGETDQAREVARTATPGDPFVAVLEGITAAYRGDVDTAVRRFPEVEALLSRMPSRYAPMLLVCRAQLAAATGDDERCEQARRAIAPVVDRWAVFSGCTVFGPMAHWAGSIDAAQGRWDAAVGHFGAAAAAADRLGARPWSVLARAQLARALRARGDAAAAETTLAAAADEAAQLGMSAAIEDVTRAVARPASGGGDGTGRGRRTGGGGGFDDGPDNNSPGTDSSAATDADADADRIFRPDGQVWTLRYAGRTAHVRDAKGLHDLRVLLGRPGVEVPATELLAPSAAHEAAGPRRLGADPLLDEQARATYRDHVRKLDDAIHEAVARNDEHRAAALDEERSALLDELRRATGLGGRPRRLGDDAERARQAVTARIRDVLRKLGTAHPELHEHLAAALSTGAQCSYRPGTPIRWSL
ncbi:AAA family ATPase [Streptomyces sp. N2-109]|uniref:AAA family ATPase n=1 Tax=Streptomyces gossypii TaxID=2883101 RepID=A0ABT2JSE2_9ACTN|nr:AAA family ATPase [Streptomyces gossypii]MCT2590783.1 AAA family ATPase [Streptomyces gossypii]